MKASIRFVWIILAVVGESATAGWIDPDTTSQAESVTSDLDDRKHTLVFSDEFNTDGRTFHDGSDPRWTAIEKDDYTNYALQYYKANLVRTSGGFLNISTIVKDTTFQFEDVLNQKSTKGTKTKNYQSGMVQGWNKFCFTGGIVELSARFVVISLSPIRWCYWLCTNVCLVRSHRRLPGKAYIGGLWPAMWMMGNLARATYVGSSNNIWYVLAGCFLVAFGGL
jgi:beta-glucanase (GH16 family)